MKPCFEHNCEKCQYIGTTTGARTLDWYICGDTILARFDDEGPRYWSCLIEMIDGSNPSHDPFSIVTHYPSDDKSMSEMSILANAMVLHHRGKKA